MTGAEANGSASSHGVDTNLYSRQIGTFGIETMGKLIQMRVLLQGMRGTGVEIAKNLVLAGPKAVVVHDPAVCTTRDMGSNYYITDEDVAAGRTRAEACVAKLQVGGRFEGGSMFWFAVLAVVLLVEENIGSRCLLCS